jgi:hypothetical protein
VSLFRCRVEAGLAELGVVTKSGVGDPARRRSTASGAKRSPGQPSSDQMRHVATSGPKERLRAPVKAGKLRGSSPRVGLEVVGNTHQLVIENDRRTERFSRMDL